MRSLKLRTTAVDPDLLSAMQNPPPHGALAWWWLGQAGFALRFGPTLLLIDPYLSDSLAEKYRNSEFKHQRVMPIPVAPEAITGCAWVLCTHGHTDHMDAPTLRGLQQQSTPRFLAPRAEMQRARERGVPADRLVTINAGETMPLTDSIAVEAIASAHERLETDADGNHKFLGYILTIGGVRIYHSGDTIPYPGLVETLADRAIDVAFLPINGRDARRLARGVPGNMTLEEALELCRAAHISHLVCHHFDLFDFNTIDRETARTHLQVLAAGIDWVLPEIGVTYTIQREGKG